MVNLCASSVIATLLLMNTAAGQPTAGKFRHRGIGYHLDIDIAEDLDDSRNARARFTFEATGVGETVSIEFPIIRRDILYDVPPSNEYVAAWSDEFIEMGQFFDDIEKLFPQAKITHRGRQIWRFYTDDRRLLSAPFQGQDRAFWKKDSPLRSGVYNRYDPNYGQLNATLTINVTDVLINGGKIANVELEISCYQRDSIRDTLALRQPPGAYYHFFEASTDFRRRMTALCPDLGTDSFYSVLVGNDDVIYVSIANVNGERELVRFGRVGPPQTSTTPVPMGSESLVI